MKALMLTEEDDLRHHPAPGQRGRDSLFFNLILPEDELGVQVYAWADHEGMAGRQVAVFGPDRRPLALDTKAAVPMGNADFDDWQVDGLEVRCTEPLHAAQVRFKGSGVELDYEFSGIHPAFSYARNPKGCPQWMAENRFEQAGRIRGELRVAGRSIAFDQLGHRDHSWGRRHWAMPQHWKWIVAQTPEVALNVMFWVARGEPGVNGYVFRNGDVLALVDGRAEAEYDPDMKQRRLVAILADEGGGNTRLELERFAIVRLASPSDTSIFEAACRGTINGQAGSGQFETYWPSAYIDRLAAGET